MTTPIETFEDILAAMERNPGLRDAMRRHVLGEELLQLPAIVAELVQTVRDYMEATNQRQDRLEADVAELKAGQARLEGDVSELKIGQARLEADVAELKAGQARLEGDVAELKTGQARLEGDVAELKTGQACLEASQTRLEVTQATMQGQLNGLTGTDYERKIARLSRRAVRRHLDIRQARVIAGYTAAARDNHILPELLEQAAENRRISDEQADELDRSDLVLLGQTSDASPAYAVIEVSLTIDEHDIDRASDCARTLAQATGSAVRPAVIGTAISDANRQRADSQRVSVIIMSG